MATSISVKKAETIAELNMAAGVRCSVFADELGYLDPRAILRDARWTGSTSCPQPSTFSDLSTATQLQQYG
jgi:hypothetical protein